MYLTVSSGSCLMSSQNSAWEILAIEYNLKNFVVLADWLREQGVKDVGLSFHPSLLHNSQVAIKKHRRGLINLYSVDFPDVVQFFDRRMLNELLKKQTGAAFMKNMKDHVGWRLLNVPTWWMWRSKMNYLIDQLPDMSLIKISSRDLNRLTADMVCKIKKKTNCRIAVELDAFAHHDIKDYLKKIDQFDLAMNLDNLIGLSIDPGHILQGYVMGKWGVPDEVIKEMISEGWPVFCLDINPTAILDENHFSARDCNGTEEEVERVIKCHAPFAENVINYGKMLELVRNQPENFDLEVCIESHPFDLANLRNDQKFIKFINQFNQYRLCDFTQKGAK